MVGQMNNENYISKKDMDEIEESLKTLDILRRGFNMASIILSLVITIAFVGLIVLRYPLVMDLADKFSSGAGIILNFLFILYLLTIVSVMIILSMALLRRFIDMPVKVVIDELGAAVNPYFELKEIFNRHFRPEALNI